MDEVKLQLRELIAGLEWRAPLRDDVLASREVRAILEAARERPSYKSQSPCTFADFRIDHDILPARGRRPAFAARRVAEECATIFERRGVAVTFGCDAVHCAEPATPFGRFVRAVLLLTLGPHAKWQGPARHAWTWSEKARIAAGKNDRRPHGGFDAAAAAASDDLRELDTHAYRREIDKARAAGDVARERALTNISTSNPDTPRDAMRQKVRKTQEVAMSELMTAAQLADYLGIHERTVWRWLEQRGGPPVIRHHRMVRFKKTAIDAWLSKKERER